jgi:hypothetical protein
MEPANDQDKILQISYGNFGCFALLTAHKLQIFRLFETEALTTVQTALSTSNAGRRLQYSWRTVASFRVWQELLRVGLSAPRWRICSCTMLSICG